MSDFSQLDNIDNVSILFALIYPKFTKCIIILEQILIAFALHRGVIVIPKSVTPERIKSNYEAQKISLDDDEMKRLYALEQNFRYLRFFMMKTGQTEADFWDADYDDKVVIDAPDSKRHKTDE